MFDICIVLHLPPFSRYAVIRVQVALSFNDDWTKEDNPLWLNVYAEGVPTYREYCENDFRGAHAFSEAETKNVRHLVDLVQPNLLAYVGIHSYAQLVIAPWGWTTERPKGSEELVSVNETTTN